MWYLIAFLSGLICGILICLCYAILTLAKQADEELNKYGKFDCDRTSDT